MILSDSDDDLKESRKIQQVTVYPMIPEAKPVIPPDFNCSQESSLKYLLRTKAATISEKKKTVFKKQQVIENGYHFSSNHESGNIQQVTEIQQGVYKLKVKSDTNSKLQSQWFYFKILGIKKATFIITGFKKANSLYNNGMKICIKQEKWTRGGRNISYFKDQEDGTYSVKFEHTFKNSQQISEIAYSFPYTYTDLIEYINKLLKNKSYAKIIKKQLITTTVLKNQIFCLTFGSSNFKKPVILITSRVHPGETVSSYILKGIIDYLLSNQLEAKIILKYYEIKIIPMLNPDGVKLGNYRFSYSGRDLNRCWKNPHHKMSSQILFTKIFLQKFQKPICMIIDLHGHSRKKDVFFYGCAKNQQDLNCRKFPYLMEKISNYFSYKKSCFRVQQQKQGTARIFLWKNLKIPYIYTLQCSFCGLSNTKKNFQIKDLEEIGKHLISGITIFLSDKFKEQYPEYLTKKLIILDQFTKDKQILGNEDDLSGSESDPQEGVLPDNQIQSIIDNLDKKKINDKNKISTTHIKIDINDIMKTQEYQQFPTSNNKQLRSLSQSFRRRISNSIKSTRIPKMENSTINNHPDIPKNQFRNRIFKSQSKITECITPQQKNNHYQNPYDTEFITMYNYREKKIRCMKLYISDLGTGTQNYLDQDTETTKLANFGPQYIRVRNYAKKLKMQQFHPKTLTQETTIKQSIQKSDQIKKKKMKLCIRSIKIQNPIDYKDIKFINHPKKL